MPRKLMCVLLHTSNGPVGGVHGPLTPCIHCGKNYNRLGEKVRRPNPVYYHYSKYSGNWTRRLGEQIRYVSKLEVAVKGTLLHRSKVRT